MRLARNNPSTRQPDNPSTRRVMTTQHIQIKDFSYDLPDERIAKYPLKQRDSSKLLVYDHGRVSEDVFTSLPDYIPTGALMVFNNTKVIQARLHFRKQSVPGQNSEGALIEVFCLEPAQPVEYQTNFKTRGCVEWYCIVGNLKKGKSGTLCRDIQVDDETIHLECERKGEHGTSHIVEFRWNGNYTWAEILDAIGELPIPPYLNRKTEESDKTTYQTVYSKIKGSVAAPTAGLHFTQRVLESLDRKGVEREELTLHVGAGGTTSVRTLESLYYMGLKAMNGADCLHIEQWMPYDAATANNVSTVDALKALLRYMDEHGTDTLHSSTQIIIAPGYRYHIVKRMVTNFHQPQSTLLLLVSAFVKGDWRKIYDYALSHDFRFLSYGDSSILIEDCQ